MNTIEDNPRSKIRRQSQFMSFNLDYLDIEDEVICRKYTQIAVSFIINFSIWGACASYTMSAVILPQLSDPDNGDIYMDNEQGSWFASILVIGSMVGALTGGLQCQFLGRKKSLILDNIIVFVSLIVLSFSHTFLALLICRFLLGISVASLLVNVPCYTGEICQPKIRMLTGSFVMVCNSGGMSSMMIIGAMVKWRTATLVMSGFPFLSIFLVIFFVPESPIWLLMKNKMDEAKSSLFKLRGNMLVVESEFNRMQKGLEQQTSESLSVQEAESCSGLREIVTVLKDKSFLKPFAILLFLFCIGFDWAGLPFIAYYMVGILIEADIPFDPYLVSAGISLFRLVVIILFSFGIASRLRRRPLYISTAVLMVIGNMAIATYFVLRNDLELVQSYPHIKWLPVISILLIYTAFALGYGSIPFMLQGEILPPYTRAIGSGLLGFIEYINMFVATKFGPTIAETIGLGGAFFMFSGAGIIVVIFAYFTMPETFNLSLEEIESIFQSDDRKVEKSQHVRKIRSTSVISFYEMATPFNK